MSLSDWRGKVALVTGATAGIGRALAISLVADGLIVVACGRRQDRLDDLAAEAQGRAGFLTPIACDLRDEAAIHSMFKQIRALHGGVDLLINNAGMGRRAPLIGGDPAAWREMFDVNVLALCLCTQQAIADMRKRGDCGQVIHLSSMSAYRVPRGSGVYASTKHAVRALTEALRLELRDLDSGIRVTAISPGLVQTEFAERYHGNPGASHQTYGRFPVLQPADIVRTVRHLLSQPPHVEIHDVLLRPTKQPT